MSYRLRWSLALQQSDCGTFCAETRNTYLDPSRTPRGGEEPDEDESIGLVARGKQGGERAR